MDVAPMTDFPPGWIKCALWECVDILDNRRVPVNSDERSDRQGRIPYYGATGQVGWIDDFLFNEELLLIGEDGAPFFDKSKPIAYIINGKTWVNNHAHVLRAMPDVTSNRFLKHFLDWFDFHDYVNGTTRLKLTQGSMNQIPVLLPPLAEQQRIVAKLEVLLGKVDACRERLEKIPVILKRFRQSVLAAACSGRLTADWREALSEYSTIPPEEVDGLPPRWKRCTVRDVAKVTSGFAFSSRDFSRAGVPAIKISNVQYGKFETKNQEYLHESFLETHKNYQVEPLTLLMALTRPITNDTLKV